MCRLSFIFPRRAQVLDSPLGTSTSRNTIGNLRHANRHHRDIISRGRPCGSTAFHTRDTLSSRRGESFLGYERGHCDRCNEMYERHPSSQIKPYFIRAPLVVGVPPQKFLVEPLACGKQSQPRPTPSYSLRPPTHHRQRHRTGPKTQPRGRTGDSSSSP